MSRTHPQHRSEGSDVYHLQGALLPPLHKQCCPRFRQKRKHDRNYLHRVKPRGHYSWPWCWHALVVYVWRGEERTEVKTCPVRDIKSCSQSYRPHYFRGRVGLLRKHLWLYANFCWNHGDKIWFYICYIGFHYFGTHDLDQEMWQSLIWYRSGN